MPDHRDGSNGPGGPRPRWVDPPELPDPKQWTVPSSRADQAPVPGWRERPARRSRSRRTWDRFRGGVGARAAPWLVLVGITAVMQVPSLVAEEVASTRLHVPPPDDTVQARYVPGPDGIGERTVPAGAPVDPAHEALWSQWEALVPSHHRRVVVRFEVASDGTGPNTFAAHVRQLDQAGEQWLLSVDPADAAANPDRYHETLVHELAHVVTLGGGVVEHGTFATLADARRTCGGPALQRGCVDADSVLGRFVARFWTDDDVAAADRIQAQDDLETAMTAYHPQVSDRFVTAYAATSPQEDVAESFTAWVLRRPQPPGGVAAEKVGFFGQDVELVALADRIRARLAAGP